MLKSLTRIGTSKEKFCVYVTDFMITVPVLTQGIARVVIHCKRGKMKKELASAPDKSLTPQNNSLKFADSYMSVSNFYLSKKGAQKKLFDISVTGFDMAGNPINLGRLQFDLS